MNSIAVIYTTTTHACGIRTPDLFAWQPLPVSACYTSHDHMMLLCCQVMNERPNRKTVSTQHSSESPSTEQPFETHDGLSYLNIIQSALAQPTQESRFITYCRAMLGGYVNQYSTSPFSTAFINTQANSCIHCLGLWHRSQDQTIGEKELQSIMASLTYHCCM